MRVLEVAWGHGSEEKRYYTGLLKVDVPLLHAQREPMMLVETNVCRKGKVGREANEHSAPVAIQSRPFCPPGFVL